MALLTPDYLQTKQYSALRDRIVLEHGGRVQPGVWDPNDYLVVQRALGANMSVDVGAGFALVDANNAGNNGLYHVQNDATFNVPITAAHLTLPRVDQVVLTVNDSVHGGASSDTPVLTTLDGTPTSGATLANRTGAVAALPANTLRIADVLVGAGVTSITTASIRDRRPWARGANSTIYNTSSNLAIPASYTSAGVQMRLECSGAPLLFTFQGVGSTGAVAGAYVMSGPWVDGVNPIVGNGYLAIAGTSAAVAAFINLNWAYVYVPTPGSHLFDVWVLSGGGATGTLNRGATAGASTTFTVQELVSSNANNGLT